MIGAIKDFMLKATKPCVLALTLSLPAAVFAILTWTRPLQYDAVIGLAVASGTQIYLAVAIAFVAAFFGLWILWTSGSYVIRYTLFPMLLPIMLACAVWTITGVVETPIIVAVATAIFLGVCVLALRLIGEPDRGPAVVRSIWLPYGLAGIGLLMLGLTTLCSPVQLPRALGSTAIVVAFATAISLSILVGVLRPKIAACVLLYLLAAMFLFPSNKHQIPVTPSKGLKTRPLESTLREWLQNRKDLDAYRKLNLPYPVVFVSSEGGGIYAAAHAYSTLSTISSNCPTFPQHVFALVGVSGGAIGNALFANEVDTAQHDTQPCGPSGKPIEYGTIGADHLSPVLARLLLVEAFDRFLLGQWDVNDRAQVLSDSFLASVGSAEFLGRPVMNSFNTASARPAVVSVTTNVLDGRRFVISPVAPETYSGTAEWWPATPTLSLNGKDPAEDVKIMDGAALSARFPWITPTGRLTTAPDEQVLLADGGYFENSGADTVTDLINDIRFTVGLHNYIGSDDIDASALSQAQCDGKTINIVRDFNDRDTPWGNCEMKVFLIHFAIASSEPQPDDTAEQTIDPRPNAQEAEPQKRDTMVKTVRETKSDGEAKPEPTSQHFLLDPLFTLMSTRSSRAEIALSRADLDQCGQAIPGAECYANPGSSMGFFRNNIAPVEWKLPLGWYMPEQLVSELSAKSIDENIFNYHAQKQVMEEDLGIMLFHLDPGLYREGADPSFNELMPGP
ncbi:hypothetical protein [Rhizobium leguminosarum]|uniref:hypothetical protein n=1 Tax=Rhizobium leguminosarum TaxID=384 RepID=UPI003F9C65B0